MSRQIFRQSSLDHLSTPERLDQVMRVTSPASWLALLVVAGLVVGAIVWSFFGAVPVKIASRGILISPGGVLDVISSSQGRVTQFLVQPGDWVDSGTVVAYVAQPDIGNQLEVATAEAADAQSQYNKILEFQERDVALQKSYLKQKREVLTQQEGFLNDRLKWLREREAIETELNAKGLLERKRVVDTKIDVNATREEYAQAENDLKHLDLEESTLAIAKEKERIDQQLKIADLQRKVETLKDKLKRNEELICPYSGTIVEFKVNAGEVVESGRALFSLLPQTRRNDAAGTAVVRHAGDLVAKLYVRPDDGKKIRPGMKAQIAPSTVKREEYGFIEGTVTSVATIPSTEEGMLRTLKNRQLVQELSGGGAPFEVSVELALDPTSNNGFKWSSSAGPDTDINPGTLAEGKITVREIHLIGLLDPALDHLFRRSGS
ncbi:NHLP bacteriocin system secretion protein [Telmatospirillum sp.]|uniref:NHLP bacteriocin system secretion protein n=1 Tax=Telmatospirillum sp. TaxID=2079197 RepID=UPI0028512891|nr:NHLP bacteriocin system secretion protein [Telmatospirillum sp.]MDR3437887.1 NHLP bacteriocin system secretion protein [Telmatospirillum sp.]